MDRRTMIVLGVLASLAGWYYMRHRDSNTDSQPQDATAMDTAYDTPPNASVQTSASNVYETLNGTTTVHSRQAMPLPYNT